MTISDLGVIEYVNPAAQALFGYSFEEAVGQNVSMLLPKDFAGQHSGILGRYLETGEKKIIGVGREVVAKRKDGTTFPVHLTVSEVALGDRRVFTGVIRDIGDEQKTQEEKDRLLHELHRRNKELNCLYRIGELVRYGDLDASLFGAAAEFIRPAISHPAFTGTRITYDGKHYVGNPFQETPWALSADIIAEGRKRGAVQAFFLEKELDLDPRQVFRAERNLIDAIAWILGETVERKEAAAKVIQASKLASVGELAAGVGHEINNPINGIINCADILIGSLEEGSKTRTFAEMIRHEADRIAAIVQNLLTFSRQDREYHSPARLCDIVDVVLSLCRKKLMKSHIELRVDVPDTLPELNCRSEQLQQVLMNLVINSMHALDSRYPGADPHKTLTIEGSEITVMGQPYLRLTVADHGAGIAPAHLERIFDPFFTTKGRDKGTGLGLSVSMGIVKDHSGRIVVDTKWGQYARFHVELPLKVEDSGTREAEHAPLFGRE